MTVDFAELFAFCELHASRVGPGERFLAIGIGIACYDRAGFPIPGDGDDPPVLVMARMQTADPSLRSVGWTMFPDDSYLSTAWLGIDHCMWGRPLFFETMYFSGEVKTSVLPTGGEQDYHPPQDFPHPETGELIDQLRYGNEEEALACHREIARRIGKRWEV